MTLKEIVAISGIGGLHKIIGRTKSGLILESLSESKKRFATGIHDKVSVLEDISMYTTEGDLPLAEVLVKINEQKNIPTAKDDVKLIRKFLVDSIQLDSERVYDSDIKKLLTWYNTLKNLVDFNTLTAEDDVAETTTAQTDEVKPESEEKAKKAAKKTAAKKQPSAKTAAPKSPKVSSKSTANTNTYRPKSV